MDCPSCKQQNPDNSIFCNHCGARLYIPSIVSVTDWEYDDFVFTYSDEWRSARISGSGAYTESSAVQWFWEGSQQEILPKLQIKIDQGWQPISEVGPSAIKVRQFKKSESNITGGDVVAWILSLGIAFFLQLVSGYFSSTYTWCAPLEFRVQLRRPKK